MKHRLRLPQLGLIPIQLLRQESAVAMQIAVPALELVVLLPRATKFVLQVMDLTREVGHVRPVALSRNVVDGGR